jgi:hypothetical protein
MAMLEDTVKTERLETQACVMKISELVMERMDLGEGKTNNSVKNLY